MLQVNLGETRWRMLRTALTLETFCFHDLRQPSRADARHFDALLDLGLFAPAPVTATAARRNKFPVRVGDPIGLFVVTDKGRRAAHMGITERTAPGAPPLSQTVARRPAGGVAWAHAAAPKPTAPGTLYRPPAAAPPAPRPAVTLAGLTAAGLLGGPAAPPKISAKVTKNSKKPKSGPSRKVLKKDGRN